MTEINAISRESVYKMAGVMRNAAFLSLAVNVFEIYRFIREPGELLQIISIFLSIAGTLLIWLFSKALGQAKKQALYYWMAACLLGYIRWVFIDARFELNAISIILITLFIIFTVRFITWVRNGLLA
jgi:hypothetical protein